MLAQCILMNKADVPPDLTEFFEDAGCSSCYVCHMVAIFREVRRVLRKDGTLWLNLGDSYASGAVGFGNSGGSYESERDWGDVARARRAIPSGLKPKDLVGMPWRVAFALQADGWYLRSDIVWSKPNPMPESITDRPTKAHEYVFLLSKSASYYYDADAIREQGTTGAWGAMPPIGGVKHVSGNDNNTYSGNQPASDGRRNKRSVWTIPTQPYAGAHFATFPEALVEPCILAGSSPQACAGCGAPWARVTEPRLLPTTKAAKTFIVDARDASADPNDQGSNRQKDGHRPGWIRADITTGWQPTCAHDDGSRQSVVLDPFAGSGTTGCVALRHGRSFVGIDISAEYLNGQALGRVDPIAAADLGARKTGEGQAALL